MDLQKFQSGASATPPSAPTSPSVGYATNGNPSTGTPATVPGAHWFHQIAAEFANILADANITPSNSTLSQIRDALRSIGGGVRPFAALPYPTISNSGNTFGVTPAAGSNGGTVTIASGTLVELCEEISAGATGRVRMVQMPGYTSPDLDVSSTYYIRARVVAGALQIYYQKGTDSDAGWSQVWTGTPGAASGGGVDSSKFDMLIAKVVTGLAATVPTVTALANADKLMYRGQVNSTADTDANSDRTATIVHTINWARAPRVVAPAINFNPVPKYACDYMNTEALTVTRYSVSHQIGVSFGTNGVISVTLGSGITAFG